MFASRLERRVTCEVSINSYLLIVIDIPKIAKHVMKDIGHKKLENGFDVENCNIIISVKQQSTDITKGINKEKNGSGDQGMIFGFAANELPEYMPNSLVYANRMTKRIRTEGTLPYLKPDGKTQVPIEYDQNEYIGRIDSIVVSVQHNENVTYEQIDSDIIEHVTEQCIPSKCLDSHTKYYINPTGRFVIGGPRSNCGLTRRKTIAACYVGTVHHGGDTFSGNDYAKVDRSGAYVIGVDHQIAICVDTMETGKI